MKVVLFLGLTMPGRGIAELCRAIGEVPGAVLVVAGFGTDYERYQAEAAALPHADRIFFPGGVAPADILPLIASADISAMPVQGDTLNHQLNTPTKLFDAMGAGVPVVASDLPGMGPIVRATGCGELCDPDSPTDIARAIRVILDAIARAAGRVPGGGAGGRARAVLLGEAGCDAARRVRRVAAAAVGERCAGSGRRVQRPRWRVPRARR